MSKIHKSSNEKKLLLGEISSPENKQYVLLHFFCHVIFFASLILVGGEA